MQPQKERPQNEPSRDPGTLARKARLTPEEQAQLLAEVDEICQSIGNDLSSHIREKLALLTNGEVQQLRGTTFAGRHFYRIARVLVCALAAERIERQWQAESTIADTKRVKRWLRNRP